MSPNYLLIHRPGADDVEAWPAHDVEHMVRKAGAGGDRWSVSVKQKDAPGLVWWVSVRIEEWTQDRLSGAFLFLGRGRAPETVVCPDGAERLVLSAIGDWTDDP